MGRPKGGKNREWSKEAKYAIIIQIINGDFWLFDYHPNETGAPPSCSKILEIQYPPSYKLFLV